MKRIALAMLMLCALAVWGAEYKLAFSSSKKGAVYNIGEKIVLSAQLLKDGTAATGCTMTYSLYREGKVIKTGKHTVGATPLTITTTLDKPGWTHIYCKILPFSSKLLQ